MVSTMCGLNRRWAVDLAEMLAGRPGISELARMSQAYRNLGSDTDVGSFPRSLLRPER